MAPATRTPTSTPTASIALADAVPDFLRGPLIVAVDDNPKPATLRAARALALHLDAQVHAIAVMEPLPIAPGAEGFGLVTPLMIDNQVQEFDRRVRRQLEDAWGGRFNWDLEVIVGNAARVITDEARRHGAAMIVMGKGRHATMERLLGGEVTLRVAMLSTVPVFAVAPNYDYAPRNAVVGVDFSVNSLMAARIAAALVEPSFRNGSTVTLAHVRPTPPIGAPGWVQDYDQAVKNRFERFSKLAATHTNPDVHFESHVVDAPASEAFNKLLDETSSDLLAVGTRGAGWWERLFVGSTATSALRTVTRSVLVVPPPAANLRIRLGLELDGHAALRASNDWAVALNTLTTHNRGRLARLEVADPAIGLPGIQVNDYRFTGATFDRANDRINLLFESDHDSSMHLSHGISNIKSVELIAGDDGRDHGAIVEHARGYAVLTFTR